MLYIKQKKWAATVLLQNNMYMRLFLYVSIVLIMVVSFVLVNSGDKFPFIIPFCLAPIVISGYRHGVVWAYLISAVLTAFCVGLTKSGLEFAPMIMSIVSFNIAPLIVMRFNKILKDYKEECKGKINSAQEEYQELFAQDSQTKEFNAQLERDVLDVARLYEITKAMSSSMEFSGVFLVLKNTLNKMFKFSRGKLILVAENTQTQALDIKGVYKIDPKKQHYGFETEAISELPLQPAAGASFLDNSFSQEHEDKIQPEDFDRLLVSSYPEQVKAPDGASDFSSVWLFSHSAPIGILTIEGISEEQIDKFTIIASQFALELQRVKLYEMVQELAIMDGLTGMFVRRYLLERCQDELRRALKYKLNLSCLMVDIDFFKHCNDKYGHLVGDAVLKQIALLIKENIREVDFAGRHGGEEFCIILPDTVPQGAVHVADRLRTAVEQHMFKAYDESIKITVSVGVSVFPDDATDLNQLIDCADQAMYKAKSEGRNKVCTWK